jgi:hypothetical protein
MCQKASLSKMALGFLWKPLRYSNPDRLISGIHSFVQVQTVATGNRRFEKRKRRFAVDVSQVRPMRIRPSAAARKPSQDRAPYERESTAAPLEASRELAFSAWREKVPLYKPVSTNDLRCGGKEILNSARNSGIIPGFNASIYTEDMMC